MSAFKPEYIASRGMEFTDLIKECEETGFPKVKVQNISNYYVEKIVVCNEVSAFLKKSISKGYSIKKYTGEEDTPSEIWPLTGGVFFFFTDPPTPRFFFRGGGVVFPPPCTF